VPAPAEGGKTVAQDVSADVLPDPGSLSAAVNPEPPSTMRLGHSIEHVLNGSILGINLGFVVINGST